MRLSVLVTPLLVGLAAPATAQAHGGEPFRVFFDWGKPELTKDALVILDEAVAAYKQGGPRQIQVAGHSDRSGPASVNVAASRRRAEAVKSYLVEHGIQSALISLRAFGESRPIVPTEDGVREMQNRRVEVSFAGQATSSAVGANSAMMVRADGSRAGAASLTENEGGAWVAIDASGLPPGIHGLHLHAIGRCDTPDFASAGPHWNPTSHQHGQQSPQGPHAGDLPNVSVGADGRLKAMIKVPGGSVDADGSALVIHALADDYRTDPSGNSGARIACAAFTR